MTIKCVKGKIVSVFLPIKRMQMQGNDKNTQNCCNHASYKQG
ncbi:hypothetical protein CEV32_0361 [Brucella rhizosphaerae]|uniref:Uncharacterized protein n=1 Tax=Brucella rhizosphaerae TaxID=571254 RepID=A0A256FHL9_9HYPH|nr:hypothetical protein CEV32_0361 [Brucella rhizosphaerae]